MKVILINKEIADKLKAYEFEDEHKAKHKLDPWNCVINGVEKFYLFPDLKDNPIFIKALADFEVCEIKDIETIEQKYYDKGVEIKPTITTKDGIVTTKYVVDSKEIDPTTLESKTILTEKIIKEPIK